MLLDIPHIFAQKHIQIYEDKLIKYDTTQYSLPGTNPLPKISKIYYLLSEYALDGTLINKDHLNIKKVILSKENNLSVGLQLALNSMLIEEKAVFLVNPEMRLTFDQLENHKNTVTVVSEKDKEILESKLIWIITIKSAVQIQNLSELDVAGRKSSIMNTNEIAKQLFLKNNYLKASNEYKSIRQYSDGIPKKFKDSMPEEELIYFKQETSKSYSNQAICHLKLCEWHKVKELCDKAIFENKENFKAHFLRAKSQYERGLIEEAIKMFQEIVVNFKDTDLVEVHQYIKKCQQQQTGKNEKKLYEQIFKRLNDEDPFDRMKKQQNMSEQLERKQQAEKILDLTQRGQLIPSDEFNKLE